MIITDLKSLAKVLQGTWYNLENNANVSIVSTDTRLPIWGSLFFAIKGDKFDGHDFIIKAQQKGAIAAVVSKIQKVPIPQLLVTCTKKALLQLASFNRLRCSNLKLAVITGTCGKTSVKEMLNSILKVNCDEFVITKYNYNNEIGVSKTLLDLETKHRFAVIEVGARHVGEIDELSKACLPNVGIINNIGKAHLKGFKSLEGIVKAKGELWKNLIKEGVCILPKSAEHYFPIWQKDIKGKHIYTFGDSKKSDFYFENVEQKEEGTYFDIITPKNRFTTNIKHKCIKYIENAVAAAAVAYSLGIQNCEVIQKGISNFKAVEGRLNFLKIAPKKYLIDDTYNANILSTKTAIEVLSKENGYRILVLGDMCDIGHFSEHLHLEIRDFIVQSNINAVLTLGKYSKCVSDIHPNGYHFSKYDDLRAHLTSLIKSYDSVSVLIKGSRIMKMEKIKDFIIQEFTC